MTGNDTRIGVLATLALGAVMAAAIWAAGAGELAFAGFVLAAIHREARGHGACA